MPMAFSLDKMERFFAKIQNDMAFLSKEDEHHLLNVMRAKVGEKIEIVDNGALSLAEIEKINPLEIKIIETIDRNTELGVKLVLGFSLLKGGHDELVLMKGTELGVSAFLPFISERTIIRLDEKERKKRLERFQKIVNGASSQSKRLVVPTVLPIMNYKEALEYNANKRFIAYENLSDGSFNLPKEFEKLKHGDEVLTLVGPEGGFSSKEVDNAVNKGFVTLSLGRRILRAETASIYLASVFSLLEEEK